LLFSVIFGMMPLFALMLSGGFSTGKFSIDYVLARGDLFIISAVLSAGALGELLAAGAKDANVPVIVSGFFSLACFAGNTLAFAFASGARPSEVVAYSSWLFAASLVASALCVWTAAYK